MKKLILNLCESPVFLGLFTLIILAAIYFSIKYVFELLSYYEDMNNPDNKE